MRKVISPSMLFLFMDLVEIKKRLGPHFQNLKDIGLSGYQMTLKA